MAEAPRGHRSYRRIGYLLRPYRGRYAVIALVMGVALCLEGLSLAAFLPLFQALLHPDGEPVHGPIGRLAWVVRALPLQDVVLAAVLVLALLVAAKAGVILLREVLVARTSSRVLQDLQCAALARYARSPATLLMERKHGEAVYDSLTAPVGVALLFLRLSQFAAELLRVFGIAVILLLASPWATAVLLAFGLTAMGLAHIGSGRRAYGGGKHRVDVTAEQTHLVSELLSGQRHLAVYGVLDEWLGRFHALSRRFADLLARYLVWLALPRMSVELAVVLILIGIIGAVRWLAPERLAESLPLIGLFAVGLFQVLPSLAALGRLRMEVEDAMPNVERVYRVLAAAPPRVLTGARPCPRAPDAIAFERVSFRYPGRPPVLSDASVTLRRGTVTALVGPSGAGKTTVLHLLLGLLEPSAGRILLDGVDLREYDLMAWRAWVGYVSQDPFLLHASVEENIRFGRRGYTDVEIMAAARIAHADEFISRLPDGYRTIVGERGAKLSGGEQQRIAIARAVLSNPELLILDEATSALDQASERTVRDAIVEACHGRTVFMVTHGTAMARAADQVVVLERGRVSQAHAPGGSPTQEAAASLLTQSYGMP